MWKLTIEDDEGQRTSLDLNLDEYTIGRAEDNDVRLTERNISRKHAILRNTVDGWELVDEGSYNGTFVNGERVSGDGAILSTGDIINIGDYRVELNDTSDDHLEEDQKQRRPDRLICVIGPVPGFEFSLDGDVLTLGRDETANLSVNHASVSRLHCELHNLGDSRWEVVDQGSSNGIRINGVELRRGIIEPGDAFEIGDVRLRFVAAGKFYRPVVEMSQALPAMPFEGMTAGVTQPTGRRMGAIVGAAVLIALVAVGGWVMFGGTTIGPDTATTAPPMAEPEARAYLEKAKEYAARDDINAAHNHLKSIPEDSPVREDPEFKRIAEAWATTMFAKAEKATDPENKRQILNDISESDTVPSELRKRAAEMALEVAVVEDLDKPRVHTPYPNATGGGVRPKASLDVPNPPPTTTTTPQTSDSGSSGGKFDMKAQKQAYMNKMRSGSASKQELRMLIAICSSLGDTACRNEAYAKWKAMDQ